MMPEDMRTIDCEIISTSSILLAKHKSASKPRLATNRHKVFSQQGVSESVANLI